MILCLQQKKLAWEVEHTTFERTLLVISHRIVFYVRWITLSIEINGVLFQCMAYYSFKVYNTIPVATVKIIKLMILIKYHTWGLMAVSYTHLSLYHCLFNLQYDKKFISFPMYLKNPALGRPLGFTPDIFPSKMLLKNLLSRNTYTINFALLLPIILKSGLSSSTLWFT